MKSLNDWTEATLPAAKIDHRSRPGPKLPVVLLPVNVGYGETGLLAGFETVSRIQSSTRLFSTRITAASQPIGYVRLESSEIPLSLKSVWFASQRDNTADVTVSARCLFKPA
jgi:hypothetical protein